MFRYGPAKGLKLLLAFMPALVLPVAGCSADGDAAAVASAGEAGGEEYRVFAMNRRGMSFPDEDFSVSAIFPPANFLVAQVVELSPDPTQGPKLLDDTQVEVRYSAAMRPDGSMTSVSSTKTNFWEYADSLYHFYGPIEFEPDQGVHGTSAQAQWMPGVNNVPQQFTRYDAETSTFTAPFVPITPNGDLGIKDYFPLFRIEAVDKVSQKVLASTVVPVPMAEPMQCQQCHATGGAAADESTSQRFGGLTWSDEPDPANNAKQNIAVLHSLLAGLDLTIRQPYLCAECHYSPVADPDGKGPVGDYQPRRNPLTISVHAWHALDRDRRVPSDNAQALVPEDGEASCKTCHGGAEPYTRGSMHQQGIVCQDCHGGMMSVGRSPLVGAADMRRPFIDEPRCESCHTGDEVSHLGNELALRKAYAEGDAFATPRLASNRRFAEQPDTLYRNSIGHGGMTCLSCHGSPHAEWPVEVDETGDNDIARQLQGHAGSIAECAACHGSDLPLTMGGPHGLHNIDDPNWVANHGSYFTAGDEAVCQACHGADLRGGRLSNARAPRSFSLPGGQTIQYAAGQSVGCADCHVMP